MEEAGPGPGPAAEQRFSNHYRRLQDIEQRVVRAIEAASFVMNELSKTREEVDKQLLHAAATGFVQQVQEAQQLVLAAVKAAAPERTFEANNYFPMAQAMVAAEKLDAVSVHVSGISKLLRQHRQQQGSSAAGGGGSGGGGGGGEASAMLVDESPGDEQQQQQQQWDTERAGPPTERASADDGGQSLQL